MTVKINSDGTTAPQFSIGIGGPTIRQGTSSPASSLGVDGDIFLQTGSSPSQYQKVGGVWVPVQLNPTFVRTTSPKGVTAIIPSDSDYHGVTTGTTGTTNLTLPAGQQGKELIIKDETGTANLISIYPGGTDQVEGGSSYAINALYGTITLIFHSGSWRLIRQIGGSIT